MPRVTTFTAFDLGPDSAALGGINRVQGLLKVVEESTGSRS